MTCAPGKGLRGKRRKKQADTALGSEGWEPHNGLHFPGILLLGDEPPRLAEKSLLRKCLQLLGFPWLPQWVSQPKLRKYSSPAHSTSQCDTESGVTITQEKPQPWAEEVSQSQSEAWMGWQWVLLVPNRKHPEATQMYDGGHSTTAHLLIHDESSHLPHQLYSKVPQKDGGGRA